MKFIVLALLCVVAYVAAELEAVEEYHGSPRFRRQDKGSISVTATKPLSGPERRPSLDIDYNQRIHDKNGWKADAFGGASFRPGQSTQPHAGINFERNFRNGGFVGGFGQAQRQPGGRIRPEFGVQGGFRFRRDANDVESEEMGY
ncbi:Hymenoptaecin [Melipona quadrifasciata]|uniref:Hymenoptaecin n=1 Tax=Melipona quadrifasciata TaxID=166423 RepID=A0A0M9A3U0_9HYME|nr:Hymenoptaecin [Melipona quadrifasciata]